MISTTIYLLAVIVLGCSVLTLFYNLIYRPITAGDWR